MFKEIVEYARRNNLVPVENRRKSKISAYVQIAYDGDFEGIMVVDKKDREFKSLPDFGTKSATAKQANAIIETYEHIFDMTCKKYPSYFADIESGSEECDSMNAIYQFLCKFRDDEDFRNNVLQEFEDVKIKGKDVISWQIDNEFIEDMVDWHDWFDDKIALFNKGKDTGNVIISSITGEEQVSIPGQAPPAIKNAVDSEMNRLRNQVYNSCAENGSKKTGFLTLTAPTGTGKTLALMKFALEQARVFHKDRIIVVLPFLSIIDQNANIYQDIFGDDVVLVDDSQTEYTDETRIQSERWSSPIIVTTSVKFFSTLFASKATDVRRLHNVANSVVVFDECQTLLSYVLNSSIEVLNSLVKYYNTTVLFSTATKPSYKYREYDDVRIRSKFRKDYITVSSMKWTAEEIMNDIESAFAAYDKIKNTSVTFTNVDVMDCEALVDYYDDKQSALYIFNTTSHAAAMYDAVVDRYGPDGCYIITSKFCAVDKLHIIDRVNERLKNGEFVRLIATQCIEAGVDFDFPVGAREFAPLDSVIQSSGRVNRNGLRNGEFLVFKYIKSGRYDYPTTDYRNASRITMKLSDKNNGIDFYNLQMMDDYFKDLYHIKGYDKDDKFLLDGIYFDCYQNVTSNYKIIDSSRQVTMLVRPVFANTSEFDKLIDRIKKNSFIITKGDLKKLSKYTLSVYCDKNVSPSSFGEPLHFRYDDEGMGWFYVEDDLFYTDRGFDVKASPGSVF